MIDFTKNQLNKNFFDDVDFSFQLSAL